MFQKYFLFNLFLTCVQINSIVTSPFPQREVDENAATANKTESDDRSLSALSELLTAAYEGAKHPTTGENAPIVNKTESDDRSLSALLTAVFEGPKHPTMGEAFHEGVRSGSGVSLYPITLAGDTIPTFFESRKTSILKGSLEDFVTFTPSLIGSVGSFILDTIAGDFKNDAILKSLASVAGSGIGVIYETISPTRVHRTFLMAANDALKIVASLTKYEELFWVRPLSDAIGANTTVNSTATVRNELVKVLTDFLLYDIINQLKNNNYTLKGTDNNSTLTLTEDSNLIVAEAVESPSSPSQ